jgi:hypothetical protein
MFTETRILQLAYTGSIHAGGITYKNDRTRQRKLVRSCNDIDQNGQETLVVDIFGQEWRRQ